MSMLTSADSPDREHAGRCDDAYMADHHVPDHGSQKIVHVRDLEIFDYPSDSEGDRHLRRYSMLFADPSRIREGRQSFVYGMENSWGELFAVKISKGRSLDEECRCHLRVSKRLGYPRLFARGKIDGEDALIMEWLEGETLERVRGKFALDDKARMSPLAVGRIGRDLCSILQSLDKEDAAIIHRDISTTNILVRTSALSVPQQISEGTFDVCLLDFGSALDVKPSSTKGLQKRSSIYDSGAEQGDKLKVVATPAFAAPELLNPDHDLQYIVKTGSAADVYALGSILYLLLTGELPFDIPEGSERYVIEKAREEKLHDAPRPMYCVHGLASDLASVLSVDPEVAVATGHAISDYTAPLTPQDVCLALNLVDEQICQIVLSCLKVDPAMRPTFDELEGMLATFCENYKENIGRALRDEPLISFYPKRGLRALSHRAQTLIKRIGQSVCIALECIIIATSSFLSDGLPIAFGSIEDPLWSGAISPIAMAAVLIVPTVVGYAIRGKRISNPKAFIRGTIGLIVGWALLYAASNFVVIDDREASYFLFANFLALLACAWCPMVLDYAFPTFDRKRRKGLPQSDWRDIFALSDTPADADTLKLLNSSNEPQILQAEPIAQGQEGDDDGTEPTDTVL